MDTGPRKRPTQADVGRLAQVSAAVVSAVVNGGGSGSGAVRVSEQTAARVWAAIRQLGYVPNVAARTLAGGRNNIVGVFTYEAVFPTEAKSFYHDFLAGIEEAAEERGCHILLFTGSRGEGRRRRIYKDGVNTLQLADGAVLLGQDEDRDELAELLRDRYPCVFVGRRDIAGGEASYAAADYASAALRMVDLIVGAGHRRIGRIQSDWRHEALIDREAGFVDGCRRHDATIDSVDTLLTPSNDAIPNLLRMLLGQRVTCVVTDDHAAAATVCRAAAELGLRVPEDLSVAALGDYPGDEPGIRPITTVTTPRRAMGVEAVRLLAELLDAPGDPEPHRAVLDCGLRRGETVAAPPPGEEGGRRSAGPEQSHRSRGSFDAGPAL
ncbi:MAG TPA: LacI family DNA-binding transcriptional regulator [Rugosimonospora sp.]|jgi:DNA-binding LacI/PurR family transcriptional regulator